MADIEILKSRLAVLETDVRVFGPAGDDLKRIETLKQQIRDIEYEKQQPKKNTAKG